MDLMPKIVTPPGMVLTHDASGKPYFAPGTPALVSEANQREMQAGLSTGRPKGDSATLEDFLTAYKGNRSSRLYHLWATMHGISPRHSMTLELQAAADGKPLIRDDEDEPAADPLDR